MGVGIFLLIAVMRIVFNWNLTYIMICFYALAFLLAFFVDKSFLPLSFDSGGVTTGPMTVPFIMSIGAGVSMSKISGDDRGDSFGITGLCSIGPIIAVLTLGIITRAKGTFNEPEVFLYDYTKEGVNRFVHSGLEHFLDVLKALAPIIVFAILFQLIFKAFNKGQLIRMAIGIGYVLVGLAIFLTGATGATVFHTKSINNDKAEGAIGTTINRETDSIFFLTTLEYKARIMEAVRDAAGLKTEGGAVIFSLPVDYLVGVGRFEDYVDGEENH